MKKKQKQKKNYRKENVERKIHREKLMISFAKWIFLRDGEVFPQLSGKYLLLMAACKSTRDKTV